MNWDVIIKYLPRLASPGTTLCCLEHRAVQGSLEAAQ